MIRPLSILTLAMLASTGHIVASDITAGGLVANVIASQPENLGNFLDHKVAVGLGGYLWLQNKDSRFAVKPRFDVMVFGDRSVSGGDREVRLAMLGVDFPIFFTRSSQGIYFNNGLALAHWTVKGPTGTLHAFGLSNASTTTAKWAGSLGLGFRDRGWIGEVNLIASSVTPSLKAKMAQLTIGYEF